MNQNVLASCAATLLLFMPSNAFTLQPLCHSIPPPFLSNPPCLYSLQVRSAIQDCHAAGIRVMVITGDNKLTAEAICRAIGVFSGSEEIDGNSMTGVAFAGLPDAGEG